MPPSDSPFALSRRGFIRTSFFTLAGVSASGRVLAQPTEPKDCTADEESWPTLHLARPEDRLHVKVAASGFELERCWGRFYLSRNEHGCDGRLSMEFAPQHFAETAIEYHDAVIPSKLDGLLNQVGLYPAGRSKIVFTVPAELERIAVDLEELLDWGRLRPDNNPRLDELPPSGAGRRQLLGFDWWGEQAGRLQTTIELPWGVFLQPLDTARDDVEWIHAAAGRRRHGRSELWYTSLESRLGRHLPIPMEILDVSGLEKFGASRLQVRDATDYDAALECTPTTNFDRLEMVTSLSRRFSYFPVDEQSRIEYFDRSGKNRITSLLSCYVEGRSLEVNRYGLSSLGGFLDLKGEWSAENGCALQSWTQRVFLGRDQEVRFERKGWLYPLGVQAVLTILSEKRYLKDQRGHFVAPVVKQAFLRIPQPNEVSLAHGETPFPSFSVVTPSTPPLDVPAGGNSSSYALYIAFLPMVGGKPFEFEIVAKDHDRNSITTRLACYFVSNRALNVNGRIPEPCDGSPREPETSSYEPPPCGTRSEPALPPDAWTEFGPEGLWKLDRAWMERSLRFSSLDSQKIALAPTHESGKTSHEVEWIEWVRGRQPELLPQTDEDIAIGRPPSSLRPFEPRARTMKLALPSVRQFSGQDSYVLGTYRNLREANSPILDPRPAANPSYAANLIDPEAPKNEAEIYLQTLQLQNFGEPEVSTATVAKAYYKSLSSAEAVALLGNLDNLVRFGASANTEASGGLATPDTPVGLLSRRFGVLGDPLMDPRQAAGVPPERLKMLTHWDGLADDHLYDGDLSCLPPGPAFLADARASASSSLQAFTGASGLGDISSMFGLDAEIIPGVRLNRVLAAAGLVDLGRSDSLALDGSPKASPLAWKYEITGADDILDLIGEGAGQLSLADFIATIPETNEGSRPLEFGISASVDWSTDALNDVDLGIIKFVAKRRSAPRAKFAVSASAALDLFEPTRPSIEARAALSDFSLEVLKSILVEFENIRFSIDAGGNKRLEPRMGDVSFYGALSFIANLKELFGSLEEALGVKIDLSPQRVEISQVISIPPTAPGQKTEPLYIGPALIENLTFRWGVVLPLLGRSPLLIYFGFASREEPFTVSVFPYGGKSYALIEATTRGVRLFEVSMEYGGVASVRFSIASGQVSLTAGMFFQIKKEGDNKTTTFAAFVKLVGVLDVAGIIKFNGLIQVTLGYTAGGDGSEVRGVALVRVSVKMGFIRITYRFSAEHVEKRGGEAGQDEAGRAQPLNLAANFAGMLAFGRGAREASELKNEAAYRPFEKMKRDNWESFIGGYA